MTASPIRLEVCWGSRAATLLLTGRVTHRVAARAIDVDLRLVLFALLTTIEILRASGHLDMAVDSTLIRFRTTRGFSLALVLTLAGLLAALFLLGRSRPMVTTPAGLPALHGHAAITGAICFGLVLLEIARITNAWPAAIGALIAGAIFLRRTFF